MRVPASLRPSGAILDRLLAAIATAALLLVAPAPASGQAGDGGAALAPSVWDDLEYRNIGPSRGGRVTAVAGHPAYPYTFYMGATGGGVWKTTDYGNTWRPITDGYLPTGSIGAIRVAPSDSSVVYVGTGSDGIRSNVIIGKGVFRSDDAGETWRSLGLEETGQIGAVEIHPTNPDEAWVAALGSPFGSNPERGVYRTRDGGATWDRVLSTSDSVGAVDLELHPDDPNTVYAAMWRGKREPWSIISGMEASAEEDGIWRTTDGGETWTRLTEGLPTGLIGKIDLAVSPDASDRVYALVEAPDPDEGLYRSDDRGETWRLVSNQPGLMNRPFYYTNVDADPTNADVVYVSNEGFYKSTDGGSTFERRPTPHGDNHDMWINPYDPDLFIQSNDGGANVTLNGGESWSTQHNQPTAELYQVDVDDRFPYWVYAGQQDNTTIMVPSLPPAEGAPGGPTALWKDIGGCETGPAVPKPGDPDIVYSNCKGRFGRYSQETGQEKQYYVGAVDMYGTNPAELPYRFQRVVPIEVSPHDPNTVYHGSQFVHRTRDEGVTWEQISPDLTAFRPERQVISGAPITRDITGEEHYSTLYVIEESPLQEGLIWTGANDGPVHVTRDGGENWTDVTPPDMPPEGRIQNIEPSPHDPARAYIAGYRYLLNDFEPYIYRTDDYGETWTRLTDGTNGIPTDHPTRVVREDPEREGLLYAGTEFGMFISFDDGTTWQPFQQNLPVTPITDLEVKEGDLVVSTMGRSFWILDDLSPLRQLDAQVAAADAHLFDPAEAHRMRYGGFGGFGPDSPADPEYREPGAMIAYALGSEPSGEVVLEVLDAEGEVVRGFSSSGEGYRTEETQGMRAPRTERSGEPRLPAEPGINRFVWDLSHPGPWTADGRSRGGPLAVPGEYTVRLSVGDWSETRPLDVLIDPRVEADGVTLADLQEQLELNLRIRDLLGAANQTMARLQETQAELEGSSSARAEQARTELEAIESALLEDEEISSYPRPMLVDQIQYLYGMTTRADQKPGRDAYQRLEELQGELRTLQDRLSAVERTVAEMEGEQPAG